MSSSSTPVSVVLSRASLSLQLMVRQARVMEGWRQLLLPNVIVDGNPGKRLMAACVKLYKDLLLLEHFAIMNYCGFSKILKKHDKVTGCVQQSRMYPS